MSAGSNGDDGSSGGPGRREVAYRLFAAEFDDADLSYSESDEERAPNYVVTPSGARVNRLFAAGVLTEVESVNEGVLRGRVVDPSGAFVTYAGQYQPDALAFLERAEPPAFVALTGKARTFEPEDSDRVFTSVRPESINEVDAATRDRWTVTAAEATLRRVAFCARARAMDARGEELRVALLEAGAPDALAAGIPLALDHYGTTEAYLEALRRLAVDALEQVAGERDEVRPLGLAPGEVGAGTLGPLPDLGDAGTSVTGEAGAADAGADPAPGADASSTTAEASTGPEAGEQSTTAEAESGTEAGATGDLGSTTDAGTPVDEEPTADAGGTADATSPVDTASTTGAESTAAAGSTADDGSAEAGGATETASGSGASDPGVGDVDDGGGLGTPSTGESGESEASESSSAGDEGLGDFDEGSALDAGDGGDGDEGLGDFDSGGGGLGDVDDAPEAGGDADTADEPTTGTAGDGTAADEDAGVTGEMYELDEEEREEIESEFGTDFSTGNEVDEPGEADIDVPSPDELAAEAEEAEAGATGTGSGETSGGAPAAEEPAGSSTAEPAAGSTDAAGAGGADATGADETDATGAAETDEGDGDETDAADVDLEDAAVEVMQELDDGDGADRDAVVAELASRYGADPDDADAAIQDALMSGQCYEPADGTLKAI